VTTGASDDIDKASRIARQMVCEWGMSELGPIAMGHRDGQPFLGRDIQHVPDYSDRVAAEIDDEVRKLVEGGHELAKATLMKNRQQLDTIVERLLEAETIEAAELEQLLEGLPVTKAERGKLLEQPRVAGRKAPSGRRLQPKPKPGLSPA
jgi:cell division protease FtsH